MSLYKFRFKYKLFRSNSPEHVTSGVETMMLLLSMLSMSFQKEYIILTVKKNNGMAGQQKWMRLYHYFKSIYYVWRNIIETMNGKIKFFGLI